MITTRKNIFKNTQKLF